jgi:hypothetical protein
MEVKLQKQFKLIRTIHTTVDVTKLTTRLGVLRLKMERLQSENPLDDFAIVDEQGNPAQIIDFLAADLAHPVAKAKRVKAAKADEYKASVSKRLKQC